MNKKAVSTTNFQRKLADCLKERLAFNITDCTANLNDTYVSLRFLGIFKDKVFDFVRNMRNNLNGLTKIITISFFVENVPVNSSARKVRIFCKVLIDKTLIMT